MNKLFLTLIGIVILFRISGQEINRFNYQVNIGTNISIPYKETVDIYNSSAILEYKSDFSYFFDFILDYHLNNRMNINIGVSYLNTRIKRYGYYGPTEYDGTLASNFIGIPLEINYQILENIPIRIGFGPYLNFLLNSKEEGTMYIDTTGFPYDPVLETFETIQKYEYDRMYQFNPLDFGVFAKIEYEYKLNEKASLVVFSKFNFGLVNSIKERSRYSYYEWRNYNLLLGIGIKI